MGDRRTAVAFFNKAVEALSSPDHAQKYNHSFNLFSSACLADPTLGQSWYQQANNCGDLTWLNAAIACYRRALRCDLDKEMRGHALCNLSWRLHQVGELEEALSVAQQAVDFAPHLINGWINLSVAHGSIGNQVASVAAIEKALAMEPDNNPAQFAAGFAYLFAGEYAEGFKYFEARFANRLPQYNDYPYPKWFGEKDKTVYLVSDQGLGDTLSFSRFLPAMSKRCKFIHAGVHPELMRAFNEAFLDLKNVNFVPIGTGFPQADAWTTFVSLPFALGLTNEEIKSAPHPKFPIYSIDTSWKVPDTKLHIGVTWGGSPQNDIDKWRSFPVKHFLDLYKVEGIQLYSLQTDSHKDELAANGCYSLIRDLSPWVRDVVDTFSLLQHLDLVITCESALAHIAGALGKEVWIPYSDHAHDYRLGHNGPILWYTNHQLFLQGRERSWEACFKNIEIALQRKM